MKKRIFVMLFSTLLLGSLIVAPAMAQISDITTVTESLTDTGSAAGFDTDNTDLPKYVGGFIKAVLGFLGIIAVILVIYAGFLWMTARGQKEQVEKAQDILKQAIIGLIIITMAYAITSFILTSIIDTSAF